MIKRKDLGFTASGYTSIGVGRNFRDSFIYMQEAVKLGKEINNLRGAGYPYDYLALACLNLVFS